MRDSVHRTALDVVAAAGSEARQAATRQQRAVLSAREAGATWTDIAEALGTTRQGVRQRFIGAEQAQKLARALDAHLRLYAQGRNQLLSYAMALDLAVTDGVLSTEQRAVVLAVYEQNRMATEGDSVGAKQADLLADQCIAISSALVAATPSEL